MVYHWFADGESTFSVSIIKDNRLRTGQQVQTHFAINLHIKDLELLNRIQSFFGVGGISIKSDKNSAQYHVSGIPNLVNVIIPHFDPLLTKKREDFELFKLIIELMVKKEHLNSEGLNNIVAIRAAMNKGLSEELKTAFPGIIALERPKFVGSETFEPYWVTGLADGESCFDASIIKSERATGGFVVSLRFRLTQHARDEQLLKSLVDFFDCGRYSPRTNNKNAGGCNKFLRY